jgi:hypothetical protein
MYICFNLLNSVLTCEEYPQIISIETIKANKLEYMCDKWIKNDYDNGNFTLSYKYMKKSCDCDNSNNEHLDDYDLYDLYKCYNCGVLKTNTLNFIEDGVDLYLQNSGSRDIVCVKDKERYCQLCTIENYPNIYKWFNEDLDYNKYIFALHVKDGYLSDSNIAGNIDSNIESCYITFVDSI